MIKKAIKLHKKLFVRFAISFLVTLLLGITLAITVSATGSPNETTSATTTSVTDRNGAEKAPNDSSLLNNLIGIDASQPLEVVILITILSLAPSILIMMTCFTRIIIVFSFLRNAMQTQAIPPNQVLTGLALFLTIFIMWPVFVQINDIAYTPYANGEISTWEAVERAGEPLKTFMLKQTTNKNMKFFMDLAERQLYDKVLPENGDNNNADNANSQQGTPVNIEEITLENYQDQLGFEIVIPAFIVSELSRAFQIGFLLFIPFLIIDIVVSSTLMSMGMMMLPPAMISLPFKIMLFVLVDGWTMLIGSLVNSFG